MNATLAALLIIFAMFTGSANAAGKPTPQPAGKILVLAISIPAPVKDVWRAFSTSEGLSTWLTPGAFVDLRPGGEWTAHYPAGKTGGGTIISFVPEKEIVISAMAPEEYPTVRSTRTHARFTFESRGNFTLVTLEQTGWQDGEEWDKAYEYLFPGNAYLLATLHRRFVNGPLDWAKEWGGKN